MTLPLIFSADSIRAIRDGTKKQTRRALNPQPPEDCARIKIGWYHPTRIDRHGEEYPGDEIFGAYTEDGEWGWRLAAPGSLVWVRETWADVNTEAGPALAYKLGDKGQMDVRPCADDGYPVEYERYPGCQFTMWWSDLARGEADHRWRSPIHMPRWASRLTLRLTDVRVQGVQEISEEDIAAEGIRADLPDSIGNHGLPCMTPITWNGGQDYTPIAAFKRVWDALNADRGYPWSSNPWVWALTFEPIWRNIDEVMRDEC